MLGRAILTIRRSTVFGRLCLHAILRAENCIFTGRVGVARRQIGCVPSCYLPPASRTLRRYHCQPDLAEETAIEALRRGRDPSVPTKEEIAAVREVVRCRVVPDFNSVRYGTPAYAQLADTCPEEIARGADDESEIGAFHDVFPTQHQATLEARLGEYTPSATDAGIVHAS